MSNLALIDTPEYSTELKFLSTHGAVEIYQHSAEPNWTIIETGGVRLVVTAKRLEFDNLPD